LSWTKAEIEDLLDRRNTGTSNFSIKPERVDYINEEQAKVDKLVLTSRCASDKENSEPNES
jgi:hypothetical protein